MLRPLPFAEPDGLVRIAEKNDKLNFQALLVLGAELSLVAGTVAEFRAHGLDRRRELHPDGPGDPEQLSGATISPSIMPLLGLRPVLGRAFQEGEDQPGSPPVALLAEAFWKRRFGGDPKVVGSILTLDGSATPS